MRTGTVPADASPAYNSLVAIPNLMSNYCEHLRPERTKLIHHEVI